MSGQGGGRSEPQDRKPAVTIFELGTIAANSRHNDTNTYMSRQILADEFGRITTLCDFLVVT